MKSIVFKIWVFPNPSETFILNQIILAINLGYNVSILVERVLSSDNSTQQELIDQYGIYDKIIVEDYKIPKHRLVRWLKAIYLLFSNLSILNYIINYYKNFNKFSLYYLYQIVFYRRFRSTDCIHVQYGTNKNPVDILKKIDYIRNSVVVSFHGHDLHFPINGRIYNKNYYHDLLINVDLLIVNTQYLMDKLLAIGALAKKTKIVPVGVDTCFFTPNLKNKSNSKVNLVTVGRLETLKGQIYGIESVRLLIEKGYNVQYTIVGKGKSYDELESLIKKYNLQDHIKLVGIKSQIEVREILRKSDIFLMTSVTDALSVAESQGLVTAEAQSCGIPVVAFDSGGIKYTIIHSETGYLCKEKNITEFVFYIENLIENIELRNSMSLKARIFIRDNFSNIVVSKIWNDIYHNLISK